MTSFSKTSLEMKLPDGTCDGDGYLLLLNDLERELKKSPAVPLLPDTYLKNPGKDFCAQQLLTDAKTGPVAKRLLTQIAALDEDKKTISSYDLAYAPFFLYGENFKEDWVSVLLRNDADFSPLERIRFLGAQLLQANTAKTLQGKSLTLLHSLAVHVGALSGNPAREAGPLLDFYFNQKDPVGFGDYLQTPLRDFLNLDEAAKAALFRKTVQGKFPDAKTVQSLFQYFTVPEAQSFTRECFGLNARAALTLFEATAMTRLHGKNEPPISSSNEKKFFPNLAQNTPYADRQKAIDDFLGKPAFEVKTNIWEAANTGARTTLKKYLWPGLTEVFSIESSKPGPTTLVFAPHFHEDNPRKVMHWIKDIPLQSGRLILIPEANRNRGLNGKGTIRMNRIFSHALLDDEMDYLIVRRTEYLMGLVDGMVGLHDWAGKDPFFISDVTHDPANPKSPDAGPMASPWITTQAKQITSLSGREIFIEGHGEGSFQPASSADLGNPPQAPWRIAEVAAVKLQALSGTKVSFNVTPINNPAGFRADNSTAYMNFFLRKPAMTFEGTKGAEQGRLLAQALYGLLLGYGHAIDPSFEKALAAAPKYDDQVYQGLRPTLP